MNTHPQDLDELADFARRSIKVGSKSFAGASRLFDPHLRASAQMLYAWCRHCDDEIDGQVSGFATLPVPGADGPVPRADGPAPGTDGPTPGTDGMEMRLASLRARTAAAIEGRADSPPFAALAYVVAEHGVPGRYPMALLNGFEMDALGHHYLEIDDTITYSYYVAGVVGIMMAWIMGVRDEATLDRACDLGIGFQLTNISRDVMDDAALGRIYLPERWLREAGVAPEAVTALESRAAVHRVVERLLATAERYYDSAYHGLPELPFRAACAIATARRVYREIGRQVRRRKQAAWDQRTIVRRPRKLAGAALAVLDASYAHTVGRFTTPPAREDLWTRPATTD